MGSDGLGQVSLDAVINANYLRVCLDDHYQALMIEPTETEDKAILDNFVAAMAQIHQEASDSPEVLLTAPHHTPVTRVDEAKAARFPNFAVPNKTFFSLNYGLIYSKCFLILIGLVD